MLDAQTVTIRPLMETAIAQFGSEQKLAEACGVTQPAIWKAKTTGKISAELAMAIHRVTNGAVPASALRTDLWKLPEHVPLAPCGGPDGGAEQPATDAAPPSFSPARRETGAPA